MKLPELDAVGVLHTPEGYTRNAPVPRRIRLLAALVLVAFVSVMVTTTVVSLGRYCLTTDAADNAALPAAFRGGSSTDPERPIRPVGSAPDG